MSMSFRTTNSVFSILPSPSMSNFSKSSTVIFFCRISSRAAACLLSMNAAAISLNTLPTETTPNITYTVPTARPHWVAGEKSPYPMVVHVMTAKYLRAIGG